MRSKQFSCVNKYYNSIYFSRGGKYKSTSILYHSLSALFIDNVKITVRNENYNNTIYVLKFPICNKKRVIN